MSKVIIKIDKNMPEEEIKKLIMDSIKEGFVDCNDFSTKKKDDLLDELCETTSRLEKKILVFLDKYDTEENLEKLLNLMKMQDEFFDSVLNKK